MGITLETANRQADGQGVTCKLTIHGFDEKITGISFHNLFNRDQRLILTTALSIFMAAKQPEQIKENCGRIIRDIGKRRRNNEYNGHSEKIGNFGSLVIPKEIRILQVGTKTHR